MAFSLSSIPGVGDIYNAVRGDPDAIKAAYDSAIAQSRQSGGEIRDFLQQQKQGAQGFFGPVQAMLQNLYGTGGIRPAQMPGVPGSQPLAPQMQAPPQGMIQGMLPPAPPGRAPVPSPGMQHMRGR